MTFEDSKILPSLHSGGIFERSSLREHPGIPLYLEIQEFPIHEFLEFKKRNRP